MPRMFILIASLTIAACGGTSPTGPEPAEPEPVVLLPYTITGTIYLDDVPVPGAKVRATRLGYDYGHMNTSFCLLGCSGNSPTVSLADQAISDAGGAYQLTALGCQGVLLDVEVSVDGDVITGHEQTGYACAAGTDAPLPQVRDFRLTSSQTQST